jgi:hypothetical protein
MAEKKTETALAQRNVTDQALAILNEAGLDMEEELSNQNAGLPSNIPIIKLDPKKSPDLIYSMGADPDTGEEMALHISNLKGIIADQVMKRALFYSEKDGKCQMMWTSFPEIGPRKNEMIASNKNGLPICASVGNNPTTEFKFATNCAVCALNTYGSPCRPKHNLLLSHFKSSDSKGNNLSGQAVLLLPPTSIKHLTGKRGYLTGLKSQNIPLIAIWTEFWTESQTGSGYDWYEIHMRKGSLATAQQVKEAVEFRKAVELEFKRFVLQEFQDPGDQPADGAPY